MTSNILPPKPPKAALVKDKTGFFLVEEPTDITKEPKREKESPKENLTKEVLSNKNHVETDFTKDIDSEKNMAPKKENFVSRLLKKKQESREKEEKINEDDLENIRKALGIPSQKKSIQKDFEEASGPNESTKLKQFEENINKKPETHKTDLENIPVFDESEIKEYEPKHDELEKTRAEDHFDEMEKKSILDLDELEKHLEELNNKKSLTKTETRRKETKQRQAKRVLDRHKAHVRKETQKIKKETDKIRKEQQKNKEILREIKKRSKQLESLQKYESEYREYKQKVKDLRFEERSIKSNIQKIKKDEEEASKKFEQTKKMQQVFLQQKQSQLEYLKKQGNMLIQQLQKKQQELTEKEQRIENLVKEEQMLLERLGNLDSERPEQKIISERVPQKIDASSTSGISENIEQMEILLQQNKIDQAKALYNETRQKVIESEDVDKTHYAKELWDIYRLITRRITLG